MTVYTPLASLIDNGCDVRIERARKLLEVLQDGGECMRNLSQGRCCSWVHRALREHPVTAARARGLHRGAHTHHRLPSFVAPESGSGVCARRPPLISKNRPVRAGSSSDDGDPSRTVL